MLDEMLSQKLRDAWHVVVFSQLECAGRHE